MSVVLHDLLQCDIAYGISLLRKMILQEREMINEVSDK